MNTRLSRVEEMVRREVATILVEGNLRDPRIRDVGLISVTGAKISPDLSAARVYVDVLGEVDRGRILAGLNAATGSIQRTLGGRIHLKRTPRLSFFWDSAIETGNRIEQVLQEIKEEGAAGEAEELDAAANTGPNAEPDAFDPG